MCASAADFQDCLEQTPRPGNYECDLTFSGSDLKRMANTMVGKACGPDQWRVEDLLLLPLEWWHLFATLWNAVLSKGVIPARWTEIKVALIPKLTGDTRPISLAAVSSRIGTKALVYKLRPWLQTWLDSKTMGGVFDSSPADVHMLLAHAAPSKAVFVAQDLTKFFDTVDWQLLTNSLKWLRAGSACRADQCFLYQWQAHFFTCWNA